VNPLLRVFWGAPHSLRYIGGEVRCTYPQAARKARMQGELMVVLLAIIAGTLLGGWVGAVVAAGLALWAMS
jgi:hypothetical protein